MKRILSIIGKVFVVGVFLAAIVTTAFAVFSVSAFKRNDRYFFGYRAYVVLSDSMSKTDFSAGDLIFVRKVNDPSDLQVGDIISFISRSSYISGETVTHKIRRIAEDENGNLSFITYGTTTDTDDDEAVLYTDVVGRYKFKISGAGEFFAFLKTVPGYFTCIFLPFLLLIIMQGINCIRIFQRYKQEELEEINRQREELERERKKNRLLAKELFELKEELEKASSAFRE